MFLYLAWFFISALVYLSFTRIHYSVALGQFVVQCNFWWRFYKKYSEKSTKNRRLYSFFFFVLSFLTSVFLLRQLLLYKIDNFTRNNLISNFSNPRTLYRERPTRLLDIRKNPMPLTIVTDAPGLLSTQVQLVIKRCYEIRLSSFVIREATSVWVPSRVIRVACHPTCGCSDVRKEDPGQP